jgi:putative intracellular protease/amidase
MAMSADKRFLADPDLHDEKVQHSPRTDDVDFTEYDLVYMAGGWGARSARRTRPARSSVRSATARWAS